MLGLSEERRLIGVRVTGRGLRRWWQPRYWMECGESRSIP
jgi:hypothetical protein